MESSLISSVSTQIVSAISSKLVSFLTPKLEEGLKSGKSVQTILEECVPVMVRGVSHQQITPTVSVVASAKPSTAVPSVTLPLGTKCSASKKDGSGCTSAAKHVHNGQYYCGVHIRSASKSVPDASYKIPASTPQSNMAVPSVTPVVEFQDLLNGAPSLGEGLDTVFTAFSE